MELSPAVSETQHFKVKRQSSVATTTTSKLDALEAESSQRRIHVIWCIVLLLAFVMILLIIVTAFFASIDTNTYKGLTNENAKRDWHILGYIVVGICLIWFVVTTIKQFKSFHDKTSLRDRSIDRGGNKSNKYEITVGTIRLTFGILTLFLSSIMIANKLHYYFLHENILFVNGNNFYYLNNMYKLLSIISICLLWKICINIGNVTKLVAKMYTFKHFATQHVAVDLRFCTKKSIANNKTDNNKAANNVIKLNINDKDHESYENDSIDVLYMLILIAWLVIYNITYQVFVTSKWSTIYQRASNVLFHSTYYLILVSSSMCIHFNYYKIYADQSKRLLIINLIELNLILVNATILICYSIIMVMIESQTMVQDSTLMVSTFWMFYGFTNNYVTTNLLKIIVFKIIFHQKRAPTTNFISI